MGKIIPFSIRTAIEGISPAEYLGRRGEFRKSIAIDPELPKTDSTKSPSGVLRPSALSKFSGAHIDGVPLWILTNPKSSDVYAYCNNGAFVSYDSSLGSEADLTAPTSSSGNGADYYDNYLYLAKNTDIARYGPLDGSPSITQSYWQGSLSLQALTDPTYPSINGVEMPNHVMHRMTDDELYVCDVNSDNKGVLHSIKTSKTTVEGDTNNGSAAEVLDFDYGNWPTCLAHRGTDLFVGLIEGSNTSVKQKPFSISVWDTIQSSFQTFAQHEFPDPIVSAIKNVNGTILVFSGFATGGCRVSQLLGNYTLQEIAFLQDAYPPLAGAVDAILNRIGWGSRTTDPAEYGCVWSRGSSHGQIPMGMHNIYRATAAGANPHVTAFKWVEQDATLGLKPVVGWKDDSGNGLDKLGTTYGDAYFESEWFPVGREFRFINLRIPFVQSIAVNMTLTVKVFTDGKADSETLTVINNTNYSGRQFVNFKNITIHGKNEFLIQLAWSGSALLTVDLPITGAIEILNDS